MVMHVKIDPNGPKVEVDGVDISGAVRRVSVDVHSGYPPEIYLELATGAEAPDVLEADGVVHVVRDSNPQEAVLEWLAAVDPDLLEKAVLAESDMATSTGESFLTQLRRLASG